MIADSIETVTVKQCLEVARRSAQQLQVATIDAHRILSRSDNANASTQALFQTMWRYATAMEYLIVNAAKVHHINLIRSY
jgi:hypothetical protein